MTPSSPDHSSPDYSSPDYSSPDYSSTDHCHPDYSSPDHRANKRPLKVLCCSGSLDGGGSERQLWQLVSQLDRRSFTPSVYLLYRRGPYLERLPNDVSVTAFWDTFDESRRYWPGSIRRMQIAHLTGVIREQEIDIVYDRTFHMTLVTSPAARRARVPRVSTIVSPPSRDFQQSRERFRFWKKRLLATAYRRAGCLAIAVSDEVADDAATFYGLNRSAIQVVYNPVDSKSVLQAAGDAVDTSAGSTAANAAGGKKSSASQTLRIVVVGRLSREKGQRLAIQALQLASLQTQTNFHLDLVGDGPDRTELERLAQRLKIAHLVTFHGFKSNPYPLIRAAHLLCIPSQYEGLPNVALEAMTLGTAVVAFDCSGSLRMLLGDDERGKSVVAGDVAALASAFGEWAETQDLWDQRRIAARQWVACHHALGPYLQLMQGLIAGLAGKRHF